MRHLPRRYFSGTELSDLSRCARARRSRCWPRWWTPRCSTPSEPLRPRKPRLQATITDRRGYLDLTFFGAATADRLLAAAAQPGARGIFAGKVTGVQPQAAAGPPRLRHRRRATGAIIGGAQRNAALAGASQAPLIGLYPLTGKLRTWTIADCVALALDSLAGVEDPLPAWVRREAGVWTW